MKKILALLISVIMCLSFLACGKNDVPPEKKPTQPDKPGFSRPTAETEKAEYDAMLLADSKEVRSFAIQNVTILTPVVEQYSLFEVEFSLSQEFTSKQSHNFNIVDIRAVIKTPSGKTETKVCFYKKDDEKPWALRYSPAEVGAYTFTINDFKTEYKTAEMSFTSTKSEKRGYLGVKNGRFVDSKDEAMLMYGINYAWGSIAEYNEYVPKLAQNGINYIRFWGQCPWSPFNLERMPKYEDGKKIENEVQNGSIVEYKGLGDYSLINAERLDNLMALFEENNIYIQYCMFNLWDFSSNHWKTNSYNKANGGMCVWRNNDTNYWTHPSAKKYQKQLLRYLYARYGYSTSFGVFEFWNEADNKIAPDSPEIGAAWHKELSEYIDTIDTRNVPKTTSYAWIDHLDMGGTTPWRELDFLDIYNGHRYGKVGKDSFDIWLKQFDSLREWQGENKTRPVFLGEHSEDGAEGRDGGILRDQYYLDALYSSVFIGGAAVTSLHWRVDNTFMLSENMLRYTKSIKQIMQPLEKKIAAAKQKNLGKADDMHAGGFISDEFALLYVRDYAPENDLAPYMSQNPRTLSGKTLAPFGLKAGSYKATFFSTLTGEQISSADYNGGILTLDDFKKDIVVKVEKK